jgi:hypothetical protein
MRKLFWLVLLMVGLGGAASAQTYQKIQGFCETGGQTVVTDGRQSTTKVQRSYPSCQITVYDTGTTNLASIASNSGGTPKSNPFTADSDGAWSWYALDGEYDVKMSGGGLASPITRSGYWIVTSSGGGSGITGSGTTGRFPIFTSSSAIGNSVFQQVGTSEFTPAATGKRINLGTGSQQTVEIANASVGGTNQNRIAKLTGAPSTAVTATTADTTKLIGIVAAGAGTTGSAQIVTNGNISCDFDGAATAGNYVGASTSLAGRCTDLGSTLPTSGVQVLGRVLETIGSGSASVYVFTGEQGRGGASGSGTTNYLSYWVDANTLGATNALFSTASSLFQFGYSVDIAASGLSELTLETDQIILKGGVSRANNAIMQTMKATASQTGDFQRFTTSAGSVRYRVDIDGDVLARGVNYTWPATLPVSTGCLQISTTGVMSVVSCVAGSGVRYAINVKQVPYNCVGDGVTDDTACIQAAITAAASVDTYAVYVPGSTYAVTGLTLNGPIEFYGDGRKTILLSSTNAPIIAAGQTGGTFYGPNIHDLQIQGSVTAGTAQTGITITDATYVYRANLSNLYITNTGSHGLSTGNVFSSSFENITLNNTAGYPLYYNSANMPGNRFESIYVELLRASAPTGFYIRQGDFSCYRCNGINNSISGSRWARVGEQIGIDGGTADLSGSLNCDSCNIESFELDGIKAYRSSPVTLRGATGIGGAGTNVNQTGITFLKNAGSFSAYVGKGYIEDTVIFGDGLVVYKNSQPIHSDDTPPIMQNGFGPSDGGGGQIGTYYDDTLSGIQPLPRADGMAKKFSVTATASLPRIGIRYIETNCAAPCTVTIPWGGWYTYANDSLTITDVGSTPSNVTIAVDSGGTINGAASYSFSIAKQSITLRPDGNTGAGAWRISSQYNGTLLTDSQVPFGNPSNVMTSSSSFTWDNSLKILSMTNANTNGHILITDSTNTIALRMGTLSGAPDRAIVGTTTADPIVLYANGNASVGVDPATLAFIPYATSNTIDLGSSSAYYKSAYVQTSLLLGVGSSTTGQLVLRNSSNAFTTTLQAGAAAASRTYTWPTNFGSAGAVLTDAAGNGTLSWAVPSASLTATYIGYGSGGNALTGTSDFSYNTTTKTASIVNGSGAASIILNGSSDTSKINFGAASAPGNQGGILMPFVGGANSSGPGIWWASSASYATQNGIYLDNGFVFQGANSTHDHVKMRAGTGTSSNGTTIWDFSPGGSLLTSSFSTGVTNTVHVVEADTLTSTGTAAAGLGTSRTVAIENGSGSNVAATAINHTLTVVTAGAETAKQEFQNRNAGSAPATVYTLEGKQNYGVHYTANVTGSITIDLSNGNVQTLTMTGNVTAIASSNMKAGAVYIIYLANGGTPFTAAGTSNSTMKYSGGSFVGSNQANSRDQLICTSDGTALYCGNYQDIK